MEVYNSAIIVFLYYPVAVWNVLLFWDKAYRFNSLLLTGEKNSNIPQVHGADGTSGELAWLHKGYFPQV